MHIRHVELSDAEAVLNIYKPYIESTSITFETSVPSVDEFAARIESYTEKYPWLIAEDSGNVIGYAYASKHRERDAYQWCVESSVYVLEKYHRSGIAMKLYNSLFSILKECGYVNVYAGITLPNPKSYTFHKKMGFEDIGVYKNIGYKFDKWHDVAWLVKTINDHSANPAAPKKFNKEQKPEVCDAQKLNSHPTVGQKRITKRLSLSTIIAFYTQICINHTLPHEI
jgi:phosphinothricin acetyltransferase